MNVAHAPRSHHRQPACLHSLSAKTTPMNVAHATRGHHRQPAFTHSAQKNADRHCARHAQPSSTASLHSLSAKKNADEHCARHAQDIIDSKPSLIQRQKTPMNVAHAPRSHHRQPAFTLRLSSSSSSSGGGGSRNGSGGSGNNGTHKSGNQWF